jgi:hypothetical protein
MPDSQVATPVADARPGACTFDTANTKMPVSNVG